MKENRIIKKHRQLYLKINIDKQIKKNYNKEEEKFERI